MKLGLPMAFQNAIIAVGGMIVQFVVNGFGVLFIAGFTATNKLLRHSGGGGHLLRLCHGYL